MTHHKALALASQVRQRAERRDQAARRVLAQRPQAPTGMFAAFKRRAYEDAKGAWERAYGRVRKLADQAQALQERVSEAVHKARSWAYAKLRHEDPQWVRRVEEHRQAEQRKLMERQHQEREAKARQPRDKGKSR